MLLNRISVNNLLLISVNFDHEINSLYLPYQQLDDWYIDQAILNFHYLWLCFNLIKLTNFVQTEFIIYANYDFLQKVISVINYLNLNLRSRNHHHLLLHPPSSFNLSFLPHPLCLQEIKNLENLHPTLHLSLFLHHRL